MNRNRRSQKHKPSSGRSPALEWRPFRHLMQIQAAHAAADAAIAVALANTLFFAIPLGEAREKVALYLGLTMTPFALLSPLVGPLLGVVEKRSPAKTIVEVWETSCRCSIRRTYDPWPRRREPLRRSEGPVFS